MKDQGYFIVRPDHVDKQYDQNDLTTLQYTDRTRFAKVRFRKLSAEVLAQDFRNIPSCKFSLGIMEMYGK